MYRKINYFQDSFLIILKVWNPLAEKLALVCQMFCADLDFIRLRMETYLDNFDCFLKDSLPLHMHALDELGLIPGLYF